jgi:hypothetical protein
MKKKGSDEKQRGKDVDAPRLGWFFGLLMEMNDGRLHCFRLRMDDRCCTVCGAAGLAAVENNPCMGKRSPCYGNAGACYLSEEAGEMKG